MSDMGSVNLSHGFPQAAKESGGKLVRAQGSNKSQRQIQRNYADELRLVKQLQGTKRLNVSTHDVDVILDENARLIQQLQHPNKTKDSHAYVQKFSQLLRNLFLLARLADQPK
ncbi:phosphoribosylformylglycinamidine synthase subunit PurQ [Babesia caballi]|uniref:Phosphoribosylformylglycinamidine synthase subunit PurQ n=1 Tax=Babesia caballi TaxID=5871 RepID=A0AAV4LLW6_BABCB|nr:phosphoribosylformylglycinamidine synthase subunit PurQ [Babesia caballi]